MGRDRDTRRDTESRVREVRGVLEKREVEE